MKKFEFNMQKILDLREFEEKQAQLELGKAVARETEIQKTLEMIAQQRLNTMTSSEDIDDINQLYKMNTYLLLLEQRKEHLLQELTQAKLVTEEKREEMKQAMMKVKALEKLKEARFEEWSLKNKKKEAVELDDINNSKIYRSE